MDYELLNFVYNKDITMFCLNEEIAKMLLDLF